MKVGVWGLESESESSEFRVQGLGFRIWDWRMRVQGLGFRAKGLGLRVEGLG